MRRITPLFLLILFAFSVFATPDSSPIDWKLSGRLFLDGGVYIHSPKELHAGAHIADVRLAAKVRIYSNWYTKIDVGFANNKITLKDAFTEYGKDGNYFRAGYMLGYYSIDLLIIYQPVLFAVTDSASPRQPNPVITFPDVSSGAQ